MCSDHLNNREIIPHLSKTVKQKICDNCVKGITPNLQIPVTAIDGASADMEEAREEFNPVALQKMRRSQKFNAPLIPSTEAADDLPALPPPPVPGHAPPPVPSIPPPLPSSEPGSDEIKATTEAAKPKKSLFAKRRTMGKEIRLFVFCFEESSYLFVCVIFL